MNATATLPAPSRTSGDNTDPRHLTCRDDNIAMCGLDVTDHDWVDGTDVPPCLLCDYIDRESLPCPVAGCDPEGQP